MKKVPIAAALNGTFRGAGMLAALKAMVSSLLFKLVAVCVLVYVLMDVCFDMKEFKEARFKVMFQRFSIADNISLPDAKQKMSTLAANQPNGITGVPADVLSDSTRTIFLRSSCARLYRQIWLVTYPRRWMCHP